MDIEVVDDEDSEKDDPALSKAAYHPCGLEIIRPSWVLNPGSNYLCELWKWEGDLPISSADDARGIFVLTEV